MNNPPAKETLLWRLEFAYNNPHREYLLIEAAAEIEHLRDQIRALESERDQWQRQALGG